MLEEDIRDGREVYSEFRDIPSDSVSFEDEFYPEKSMPTQTGV